MTRVLAGSMALAVASASIVGCATVDEHDTSNGPDLCGVLGLATAGRGARDCGMVDARTGPHDSGTRGLACALDEEARGRPFRIGRSISGTDYGACNFVVRDRDGQMWFLQFGFSANECADDGACGNVYVGRCPGLRIEDVLDFPDTKDCVADGAAYARERAMYEPD